MGISDKQQKWVDIIQWILIIGLLCVVAGCFMYSSYHKSNTATEE